MAGRTIYNGPDGNYFAMWCISVRCIPAPLTRCRFERPRLTPIYEAWVTIGCGWLLPLLLPLLLLLLLILVSLLS